MNFVKVCLCLTKHSGIFKNSKCLYCSVSFSVLCDIWPNWWIKLAWNNHCTCSIAFCPAFLSLLAEFCFSIIVLALVRVQRVAKRIICLTASCVYRTYAWTQWTLLLLLHYINYLMNSVDLFYQIMLTCTTYALIQWLVLQHHVCAQDVCILRTCVPHRVCAMHTVIHWIYATTSCIKKKKK